MEASAKHDAWQAGENYDAYMGRWSALLADKFLALLDAPSGRQWLDIGCGTGALSKAILRNANPGSVVGIDPSADFVAHAAKSTNDSRARFIVGEAEQLPLDTDTVDIATSGLVLNFVPEKSRAIQEMRRVTRSGGIISFYVWDYPGGGVEFIDLFWKCAAELNADAVKLDEGKRFPFCTPDGLSRICEEAGLANAVIAANEIETIFPTFGDFIHPFTLGAGPAPGYFASRDDRHKAELSTLLAERVGPSEPINLTARAWSVTARN